MLRWVIAGFVVIGLLAGLGGGIWLRTHGFSARRKPTALETFVAHRLRRLATPAKVRALENPIELAPLAVAEGRDHFADHCAICHANDGGGKTMINEGLYPPAPDLRDEWTQGLTDGELFAIIRDGIRFTGMPGWGGEDAENWKLVLFIRHLSKLTDEELRLMREVNSEPPGGGEH